MKKLKNISNNSMTLQQFISKLNWRQVFVHFIATCFFMYSFQILELIFHTQLIEIYRQTGNFKNSSISANEISYFVVWRTLSDTIGLLVAFGISLAISIKRKWFWFNSFLVLVVVLISSRFILNAWEYLKVIFLTPGEFFKNTTIEFLVNGLILLVLGVLIFFLPISNKFIANRNSTGA